MLRHVESGGGIFLNYLPTVLVHMIKAAQFAVATWPLNTIFVTIDTLSVYLRLVTPPGGARGGVPAP